MAQPCRLRLGSETVEVDDVERTPRSGLTTLTGGDGMQMRKRERVLIWKLEGNAGQQLLLSVDLRGVKWGEPVGGAVVNSATIHGF